jgi:uroporphyrin-III C-methyltransferase/precorrin-2 dehydrogenase/sirohydrochlorin ferrochelatase
MNLNWNLLTQPQQTVVVYMGLGGLKTLCAKLIEHGLPPDKPIALVQQATTRNQRVFTATLGTLPDIVEQVEIKPPTLIIVGDVVKLHEKLAWFRPE